MNVAKLVKVDDGLEMYTASTIDARMLYREIFTYNGYGELSLPPRPYVVDVGANIGVFLLRVTRAFPDAEVLAFEPMPKLAETVRRNIDLHRLTDVTFHEVALGDHDQRDVSFTFYPMLPSSSTRYPQRQEQLKAVMGRTFPARVLDRMYQGQEVTMDVARLSSFLADDRAVDLLKVDTSGSELEVLGGIDEQHWPLIRRVLLDVQDQHGRIDAVSEALAVRGLHVDVRPAPMAQGDGLNYVITATRGEG